MLIASRTPSTVSGPRTSTTALLPRLLLSGALLCAPSLGLGQAGGINQGGPGYLHDQAGSSPMAQQAPSQEAQKLEQMRQADRRKHLADESARLVELSNELKLDIDHASNDQLSLDTMRKANEIEKLAHDLKKWIKS